MHEAHHTYGAIEAERILRDLQYPQERIEQVKTCIMQHRGSVNRERTSKESVCVASADAMAHIDHIPSLLHFVYVRKKLGVKEGSIWVYDKMERSWNKLCSEAQAMIAEKYNSAKNILRIYKEE